MKERIQKVIASGGEYSRRQVEKLIEERKIKVNGIVVTTQGVKVDPATDRIQIERKAFRYKGKPERVVILINKPRRVVVTRRDPEGRKTVFELLPPAFQNLKPVGRLDFNSQGALLMTNDGELANQLSHPSFGLEKIYEVKLSGLASEKQINVMKKGIILDGSRTLPCDIKIIRQTEQAMSLLFKLHEGKNRQIRRMCEKVGLTVKELRRVAIGPIKLKTLRSGHYRELLTRDIKKIEEALGPSHS